MLTLEASLPTLSMAFNTSGNFLLFTSPDQANTPASISAYSFVVTSLSSGFVQLRTDASRQVRARCDTATVILYIVTYGWIESARTRRVTNFFAGDSLTEKRPRLLSLPRFRQHHPTLSRSKSDLSDFEN
jgi:hypothetical protein